MAELAEPGRRQSSGSTLFSGGGYPERWGWSAESLKIGPYSNYWQFWFPSDSRVSRWPGWEAEQVPSGLGSKLFGINIQICPPAIDCTHVVAKGLKLVFCNKGSYYRLHLVLMDSELSEEGEP